MQQNTDYQTSLEKFRGAMTGICSPADLCTQCTSVGKVVRLLRALCQRSTCVQLCAQMTSTRSLRTPSCLQALDIYCDWHPAKYTLKQGPSDLSCLIVLVSCAEYVLVWTHCLIVRMMSTFPGGRVPIRVRLLPFWSNKIPILAPSKAHDTVSR